MIYSCFNEQTGLYDYYEDDDTRPVNGDLPVPSLPSDAGKTGAPARESGRPLPYGAHRVGSGWNARGVVSSCSRSGSAYSGDSSTTGISIGLIVTIAISAIVLDLIYSKRS